MTHALALIIDDNPTNIVVLDQLLRLEDIASVKISATRDLGSQLDAFNNVDVVFLDLEMPVINGYQAFEIIRAHANFGSTKIVAYSVHVSELHHSLDLGFDGFLGKPINAEAFPDQIKRILQGEQICYVP